MWRWGLGVDGGIVFEILVLIIFVFFVLIWVIDGVGKSRSLFRKLILLFIYI